MSEKAGMIRKYGQRWTKQVGFGKKVKMPVTISDREGFNVFRKKSRSINNYKEQGTGSTFTQRIKLYWGPGP